MKSVSSLAILVLATFAFTRPAAGAEDLASRVEAALPPHAGACVLAIDNGEVLFMESFGLADVENNVRCTPATNFRMASVSKQFTATAVMLLVDQKKLSLDDALDKFFPGFPEYGKKITVEHLLTHTSGLPDYENLIPAGTTLPLDDLDVVQLLMETKEPLFVPGEKWQYSNSGYALLGMIVEVVAERPFHEFMVDEVFTPLGMKGSLLYQRGLNEVKHRAYGHERKDDKWVRADQSLTSAIRGDGVVYTSLEDYLLWLGGLDQRALLKAESYAAMFAPQAVSDRNGNRYGFGWFIDEYRGKPRFHHSGDSRGFRLNVQLYPQRRAAVLVQLNSEVDESALTMTKVGERVADLLIFDRKEE